MRVLVCALTLFTVCRAHEKKKPVPAYAPPPPFQYTPQMCAEDGGKWSQEGCRWDFMGEKGGPSYLISLPRFAKVKRLGII